MYENITCFKQEIPENVKQFFPSQQNLHYKGFAPPPIKFLFGRLPLVTLDKLKGQ